MDSGDPNIIDKVFTEIINKTHGKGPNEIQKMLLLVNKIDDAVRHLRNYAKKRKDNQLLESLIEFQNKKSQADQGQRQAPVQQTNQINILRDYTQAKLFIQDGYQQEQLSDRFERLKCAGEVLVKYNKDDFYSRLVGELEDVNQ